MSRLSLKTAWLRKLLLRHSLLLAAGTLCHLFLLSFGGESGLLSQLPFSWRELLLGGTAASIAVYAVVWRMRFAMVRLHGPAILRSTGLDLFIIDLLPLVMYFLTADELPLRALLGLAVILLQAKEISRTDGLLARYHARIAKQRWLSAPPAEQEMHISAWCLTMAAGLLVMQMYNGGVSYSQPSGTFTFWCRTAYAVFTFIILTISQFRVLLLEYREPVKREFPPGAYRWYHRLWHVLRRLPWPFWLSILTMALALWCADAFPRQEFRWLPAALLHQLAVCLFFHYSNRKPSQVMAWLFNHPAHLLAASFVLLIATGAYLLTLPACDPNGHGLSVINALFTATSGTCVTGLSVISISEELTLTGQIVLAAVIQLGGLGIMTVSAFIAVAIGHKMGIAESKAFADMTGEEQGLLAKKLILIIVLLTVIIEAAGTGVFAWLLSRQSTALALPELIWQSYFMSLNSFCNAGFALTPESYVCYQNQPPVLYTSAVLIVLGGLGYGVIASLGTRLFRRHPKRLSTHVKIVLWMSAILLFGGMAALLILEQEYTFVGMTWCEQLANAFLQSASGRTCGVNSVDLSQMHPASQLMLNCLMFIGAAPGSTGGGIRVTTVGVLLMLLWAMIRGREQVVVNRTTIPESILRQAMAAFLMGLIIVIGTTGLLSMNMPEESIHTIIFEAISAMGTVGMSLGLTGRLSSFGKLVLIVVMFIARVGFLTVLATMRIQRTARRIKYPASRVLIG